MSSKNLNINKPSWSNSILSLSATKKIPQSLQKLCEVSINTLEDLIWILPLRIQKAPELSNFSEIEIQKTFLGKAKLINTQFIPANGRRGKGNVQLFNASCIIKDFYSDRILTLKWFNTYPGLKKQLEKMEDFTFMGIPSEYKGNIQIVNPKLNPKEVHESNSMLVEYPTVNSISGNKIKAHIHKIPKDIWDLSFSNNNRTVEKVLNLFPLHKSFQILHGKLPEEFNYCDQAKQRLIYEEFFENQLKVLARKSKNLNRKSVKLTISKIELKESYKVFPYELTEDQVIVSEQVINDLCSDHPMMRMIQGDVGCGKTTVAILAAILVVKNGGQVALMCPTEALANQHTKTFQEILGTSINISLIVGSTKPKEKKVINENLRSGEINIVIGTHSLIQESIGFKNLALAIIDEQHKFGVDQRQKLLRKGNGVHSLIMTATPIPRTLQLAQYGDLDISTIRIMPGGRKGIKSRIVTPNTYEKYLSFLKTRMSMGEQVYVVVPAIEESETLDLNNVNSLIETYKKYFPEYRIQALHGQLKANQKTEILDLFTKGEIDLLISTTVIEVGINILNSTVISIYNPDRFGLSSLHQLRGRVGRGEKPGFCFLITDQSISNESMNRIKVLERTLDGFEIAEADLVNRGQGDLFGASQSGHISSYKLANIIRDFVIFEKVTQDIEILRDKCPEVLNNYFVNFLDDTKVSSTI